MEQEEQLYNRKAIIEKNKEDFNFFSPFCLPDIVVTPFPEFYVNLFFMLVQELLKLGGTEIIMRFALSLPRGNAKTTFIKLFVVYGIIHDLFSFVIIICANEDRAQDFLSDVHDILSSRNISTVYDNWGTQLRENNKDTKRGSFLRRKIVLQAVGAGTSFRGIIKDNMRPDCIIFDDAQSEKNAESQAESARLLKWVTGTAIKTKSPVRCAVIWIGNMYDPPENCILYQLAKSPNWISLITGGILADGNALWPELHSKAALLEEYLHDASLGQGATWFAEIQNDPTESPNRLLPNGDFPLTPKTEDMEAIGAFVTVDPAGRKKNSDDNVVTGHLVYPGGMTEIYGIAASVMDPQQTIMTAIKVATQIGARLIFPESNAYQETLAFWMEKALVQLELDHAISIIPVHNSAVKLGRIREFIKQLLAGTVIVTDYQVKAKILFQALAFNITRTDNKDDILDCCAMGEKVKNTYLHQCLYPDGTNPQLIARTFAPPLARVRRNSHALSHLRNQRYSR